jgi:starvation-inducible DNA-binding protein
MFTTQNNLPENVRTQVADLLNRSLADLSDLYSQTKQAHWNVRGPLFYQLHKLFDDLAAGVAEHLDDIAERVAALGGFARGTVRQAAAQTRLEEFPDAQATDLGYVDILSERFAHCANETRLQVDEADELGDTDTADLLTAVSRNLDKSLWMLEAHLRKL